MAMPAFSWGPNGQKASPSSVKRQAEIAAALMSKSGAPKTLGEGFNRVGEALLANSYTSKAAAGEEEGAAARKAVMDALMGNADPTMADISGALGNEWVTSDPGSSAIVQALLGQELQQNDPLRQQQLALGEIELENARNPQPEPGFTLLAPEEALTLGLPEGGSYQKGPDGKIYEIGGGGTTINNMGNIPAGYAVDYDEEGRPVTMSPVPGSPAALEAAAAAGKEEMRDDQAEITSGTILNEAGKARDLISGWSTGPGQWVFGNLPFTQAAELNRHVSSLKAIASSENINMMRQSSPTGAAMGNTSDADLKLLQDKAGALDPQSPNFVEMLDDYEHTLLRIVHGPEVGDAVYQQTRGAPAGQGAQATPAPELTPPPEGVAPEEWQLLTPEERALWQN